MPSTADSIAAGIQSRIEDLELTVAGVEVEIHRRAELVLLDGIDTKPCVLFKMSGPEDSIPWDSEGSNGNGAVKVTYAAEIVLATAQNRNPEKDEANLLSGRQKIRKAFEPADFPECEAVLMVRAKSPQGPGGGAQSFREGLRPDLIRVEFTAIEDAGN